MKKILIIGAKGMLGQALEKVFSSSLDYAVTSWDKDSIDIANETQVETLILEEQPEVIINCAALNKVDLIENDEQIFEQAKKINGFGPKYLAQVAKKIDAVFVQYVTDYVFDGEKGEYVETDETNPISKYGISKELGEKNVQKIGGKYYLIRISKLFGEPGSSEGAKSSFFQLMLNLAQEKKKLKVVNEEKSRFTYVPDLAQATKELIEKKYPFGIYHLTNEGSATWYEGARKLFELAGNKKIKLVPVSSAEFPTVAKRPRSSVLLNTKFPKLRNYEQALKEWLDLKK